MKVKKSLSLFATLFLTTTVYGQGAVQQNVQEGIVLDRIQELTDIVRGFNEYGIVPFGIENFPAYMPDISFISSSSSTLDGMYQIGLLPDVGNLGYNERNSTEMLAILNAPIPQETIDFILAFTSLAYEDVHIGYSIFFETPLLDYLPTISEEWGENSDSEDDNLIDPFQQNVNAVLRMGAAIEISPFGFGTAGHPTTTSGNSFMTSPHTEAAAGRFVIAPNTSPIRVGIVSWARNNEQSDTASVDLTISGSNMSRQLPWGSTITNFRGLPLNNQAVRTIGMHGRVMDGTIVDFNATLSRPGLTSLRNQILVYPDRGQAGDSGAALIKTQDNAVLGTKRGVGRLPNGSAVMVFTNVNFY